MPKKILVTDSGRGKKIVDYLIKELNIKEDCIKLSIHFEAGKYIKINCEYLASEKDG